MSITLGSREVRESARDHSLPETSCPRITLLVPLACGLGLALCALVWQKTWDDSAITLGYARMLAVTGRIAFGKYGPVVEGFTSFLWMLLATGLALLDPRPSGLLQLAKLANVGLYLANAWLVLRLADELRFRSVTRVALAVAYAVSAIAIVSIPDAMENHLFLGLHLGVAIFYLRRRRDARAGVARRGEDVLLSLALFALLLCRPEGALACGALALASWQDGAGMPARARLRALVPIACAGVGFALFLAWRAAYFGALIPNSVAAKRWPPYFVPLARRIVGGAGDSVHFALAALLPFLPYTFALAFERQLLRFDLELRTAVRGQRFFVYAIAAHVAFSCLVVGGAWGTRNRVQLAVLPFAWCLLCSAFERVPPLRMQLRQRLVLGLATLFVLAGSDAYYLHKYATNRVTLTAIRQRMEPATRLADRMTTTQPWRIAGPDMGATLLWWGLDYELIDTALLNDRSTAVNGWTQLEASLRSGGRIPDILDTHWLWTNYGKLDQSALLATHYKKVWIGRVIFFLRDDHVERLRTAPPAGVRFSPRIEDEAAGWRRVTPEDEQPKLTLVPGPVLGEVEFAAAR